MMLSLCLIVKPTNKEAELLDRCLGSVANVVDEICVTQAGDKPNKQVSKVIKQYQGKESCFKWVNDFSKARNYNFAQATGDYILWLDSDDVLKGADKLEEVLKTMAEQAIDAGVMNYLYHFNEAGFCDTKHIKTRIVKNDGCVEWVGKVHEDFKNNRAVDAYFIEDIEVLHLTDDDRVQESAERNLKIAQDAMTEKPDDPRSYWLMGNALIMKRDMKQAQEHFKKFIEISNSEDEKYMVYNMLFELIGNYKYALEAIYLRPSYPDAYLKLGKWLFDQKQYTKALNYLELGLQMPIPERDIIAYNPREYDLYPLLLMVNIYFELGKLEKAVLIIDKLKKLFPKYPAVKKLEQLVNENIKELLDVDKYLKKARKIKDKSELRKFIDNLPKKVASHPKMCYFVNEKFVKKNSTGHDFVYYCGFTSKSWNPDTADKDGVGGSEEAVINLSKLLAKKGWNVTVYNNCGKEGEWDGVKYKFYWKYNVRDKQDITIIWRHPKPCDYKINSSKIFIDLHDVIPEGEFNAYRLGKITKVMVKTKAHRDLFPNIPDDKIAVIPNGVDPTQFEIKAKKNPYLILNTSSPDRHLDATLDIFEELIKREPDKPWKLAWYYGWGVYDGVHADNQEMKDWKIKQMKRFNKLVKEGRAEGGYMINHKEIAKKYLEAGIFLYPTQFFEIHCISAVKAQLAECKMVTSDFAALKETVNAFKVHTDGKMWEQERTFGDSENLEDYLKLIKTADTGDKEWAKKTYNWDIISNQWSNVLQNFN